MLSKRNLEPMPWVAYPWSLTYWCPNYSSFRIKEREASRPPCAAKRMSYLLKVPNVILCFGALLLPLQRALPQTPSLTLSSATANPGTTTTLSLSMASGATAPAGRSGRGAAPTAASLRAGGGEARSAAWFPDRDDPPDGCAPRAPRRWSGR